VPDVLRSAGESLDSGTRANMESSFTHDFSRVRIHSDDNAARSARSIDARAYTVGRHIVFGDGQYAPGTMWGKRLLAHELAHVIQQRQPAGPVADSGLETDGGREAFEQEAGAAASVISAGKRVHVAAKGSAPRLQLQRADADKAGTSPEKSLPSWNPAQLGSIQAQLKRLGLYRGRVDRRFGEDTEDALVEAFASDDWRKLTPVEIIKRLTAASPPAGKPGEHNLRYGEMFKDGLLDITLGIGYDESGAGKAVYVLMRGELAKEGFEDNAAKAKDIYRRTGHAVGPSVYGMYFVWKNELTYRPPAAAERKIAVVVRLVSNPDEGHGAEAAAAFEEGMKHSDVAFYAGHGRFGSGPDFDRALKVTFLNPDGTTRPPEIDDYEKVEGELINEVKSHDVDVLWRRFEWMVAHNMIKVEGENRGNIYLNPTDRNPGEFAARLMYWNLNRKGASAVPVTTGRKGELARPASERSYRLWVFNGCRTQDYVQSIRSTPGADPKSTDVIATQRTINWSDYVKTIVAFMQGILAHQSAEQIVKEMDATQLKDRPKGKAGVADVAQGLEDNPVFR
jgi:Domain of unknown function (DUF4157)/Putative peptidoglycan binding domain